MAQIEKRGDSYRIRVSVGYDASGRKISRSTTFKPNLLTATGKIKAESTIQKEVAAFAAKFEQDVKSGSVANDNHMKFYELAEKYLKEYAFMELTTATAEGYKAHLEKKLIPQFGHRKIRDLCTQQLDIQKFYNDMAKPQKDGSKLAASTIKRSMNIFSGVMKWGVDMQLIPSNPLERVKPPKEERKEPQPKSFTIDELKRFIAALDMPQEAAYKAHDRAKENGTVYHVGEYTESRKLPEQYKLFYIMAAFSGCRRGELIALDWSDIDFEASTISISKSVSKTSHGVVIKSTKTSSGVRILHMPPSVMHLAKLWKIHQGEMRLQFGTAWKGKDNVFCQIEGARMYPDTVTAKFKDIIRNYNARCNPEDRLPDIPLHGLRHTAASILINQHTDIAAVSKRLGHSRTSVTLDIYTHAIKEADRAASDKLEDIARSAGIS